MPSCFSRRRIRGYLTGIREGWRFVADERVKRPCARTTLFFWTRGFRARDEARGHRFADEIPNLAGCRPQNKWQPLPPGEMSATAVVDERLHGVAHHLDSMFGTVTLRDDICFQPMGDPLPLQIRRGVDDDPQGKLNGDLNGGAHWTTRSILGPLPLSHRSGNPAPGRVAQRPRAQRGRSAISWLSEPEEKPARSSATKVKPCARPSATIDWRTPGSRARGMSARSISRRATSPW
jgi:hypothetical protein